MGVYIKGFDFPKACWFCDFCRAYNEPNHGYFCCALNADLDKTTEIIQTQRDKHCPLVELPSHGRLGDLDELHKEAVRRSEKTGTDDSWYNCADRVISAFDIENAPTIIPAEEGE